MSVIQRNEDFRRILALPRRIGDGASLVADMTALLKRPGGTMTLRPLQALALHDIGVGSGGFVPLGVGEGKTLVSLLAAYVLDAKRPLLLLPAGLIVNAERARISLTPHWLIPSHVRIFSNEMLGRVQSATMLDDYAPDLIVIDEAHRYKDLKAACVRRLARYMAKHSGTTFIPMSGTMMRDSILDFAHLLWWSLKAGTPLPADRNVLEAWASALDEPKKARQGFEVEPTEPGALLDFCTPDEIADHSPVVAARKGFRRRLEETPGVIASSTDGEHVDCSIYVQAIHPTYNLVTEEHFHKLRGDRKDPDNYPGWQRPDGKEFEEGVEVWACARQLALGLHYEWNPPPPDDWMKARKAWSCYVRAVLSYTRTLDSPDAVAQAILAGQREDPGGVLAKWRAVRPSFKPKTVPVWHDDSVLKLCADWAKTPGIVWTEHGHFGRELSRLTGLPYYGRKGFNADGGYIEDGDPKRSIIASIKANRDGKNLQARENPDGTFTPLWHRNLLVTPPDGADVWQQTIARTHRPRQMADQVTVDVLFGCREHVSAWRTAFAGAQAIRDTVGGVQKLLLADVAFTYIDLDGRLGWRW